MKILTYAETKAELQNRPEHYQELSKSERQILQQWIKNNLDPYRTKTYKPYHSSYGIKHWFEHSPKGFYVSNGQFKGAMLQASFEPKDENTLNWTFCISKRAGHR